MAEPRQEPPPRSRIGSAADDEAVDREEHGLGEHGRGEHGRDAHNRGAAARSSERSGPLLVERHRKADGRQLILYRRAAGDG